MVPRSESLNPVRYYFSTPFFLPVIVQRMNGRVRWSKCPPSHPVHCKYTFIRNRISDLNNRPVNVFGRSHGNILHFAFPDQDNIKSLATHNWTIASHDVTLFKANEGGPGGVILLCSASSDKQSIKRTS